MCICTQDPAFSKQINDVPHMMTVTAVGVLAFALVFAVNSSVRKTATDKGAQRRAEAVQTDREPNRGRYREKDRRV